MKFLHYFCVLAVIGVLAGCSSQQNVGPSSGKGSSSYYSHVTPDDMRLLSKSSEIPLDVAEAGEIVEGVCADLGIPLEKDEPGIGKRIYFGTSPGGIYVKIAITAIVKDYSYVEVSVDQENDRVSRALLDRVYFSLQRSFSQVRGTSP